MADTVAATLSSISSTFRENAFKNPALDENNEKSIFIQRQLRAFKNEDPPPNGQQCLPLSSFKKIYEDKSSPLNEALGQLISGALFFACRSCEYSKVPDSEKRKTKILILNNIRFFKAFNEITITSLLHSADFVEITFVCQKSDVKNEVIIQHRASGHFCPAKIWAQIKSRILSYKNTSGNSAVNTFLQDGKLVQITSEAIRIHLRKFVLSIDPFEKFYKTNKIGTHTIRTSFAMILHSAKVAAYIIKMMGRWASDAWLLRYIRNRVPDFSKEISQLMVKTETAFFNVPSNSLHYTSNPKTTNYQIHGACSFPEPENPSQEINIYCAWVN